jgi:hypothetical protein
MVSKRLKIALRAIQFGNEEGKPASFMPGSRSELQGFGPVNSKCSVMGGVTIPYICRCNAISICSAFGFNDLR